MKTIKIEGMRCGHCQVAVTEALKAVAGVASVEVDLAGKKAMVEGTAADAALKEAVEDCGFDVVGIE